MNEVTGQVCVGMCYLPSWLTAPKNSALEVLLRHETWLNNCSGNNTFKQAFEVLSTIKFIKWIPTYLFLTPMRQVQGLIALFYKWGNRVKDAKGHDGWSSVLTETRILWLSVQDSFYHSYCLPCGQQGDLFGNWNAKNFNCSRLQQQSHWALRKTKESEGSSFSQEVIKYLRMKM